MISNGTREVILSGGVTVTTSSGYVLETAEMAAKLDRTGLESRAPVVATGPAGDIRADQMVLSQDTRTLGAYVLVFKGAVRLIYQPGG